MEMPHLEEMEPVVEVVKAAAAAVDRQKLTGGTSVITEEGLAVAAAVPVVRVVKEDLEV